MARPRSSLVLWSAFGVVLAGCKHDKNQEVAASYSTVTRPVPVVAAPLSAVGVASIPVEEEYEERAAGAISAANLHAQVSEIEDEMAH